MFVSDPDDKTGKRGSRYPKDNSWKYWGNNIVEPDSSESFGRRFTQYDQECTPRNMLISVVARDENTQVLIDLRSATFNAWGLKLSSIFMLAGLLVTSAF